VASFYSAVSDLAEKLDLLATIRNAMPPCASSPYAQRGALFAAFKQHYGRPGSSVPVWKALTRVMNPTVPQSVIDEAVERDAACGGRISGRVSLSIAHLAEQRASCSTWFASASRRFHRMMW
jgi:hypothetical protein